jgi:hypothetical protein
LMVEGRQTQPGSRQRNIGFHTKIQRFGCKIVSRAFQHVPTHPLVSGPTVKTFA